MIIKETSFPRAALIGNPSDGFYGKTIAFLFSDFSAEVVLYESPELEILPAEYDSAVFRSLDELAHDVNLYGYYGGLRLLKAAIKRFHDHCTAAEIQLHSRNFTIRYRSDIPYRLGLAGSSAIITACMKALMRFYEVTIPPGLLANLVLSVEKDELKISAGLQDRVAQAFECPVYMDFNREQMEKHGVGLYDPFPSEWLPPVFIAYDTDLSEGSEVVHNDFSERYHFGDKQVRNAVEEWAELTDQARGALVKGDVELLNRLVNRNFDIRKDVMNISSRNKEMVETARSAGVSAKFTGSGGAIIGLYSDDLVFESLRIRLNAMGVEVIKPTIVCNQPH